MNIGIYLSIHEPHQPVAYEKSKSVALHSIRIISTMKALEYLRQFFRFKSTACIWYRDKLTTVHFIKANLNSSTVTVFDRIFDQILHALCKTIWVAGKNAVIIFSNRELRSRDGKLGSISRLYPCDDNT